MKPYYQDDHYGITIYHGDCREVLPTLEPVDLVITSPPYDNLREYKGYNFNFEDTANKLTVVIKQGGVVVWVVADQTVNGSETGTSFKQALFFKKIGLNIHDTMIYKKDNPIPLTHNRYEQCFEYMFVFSKGKPKTFNPLLERTVTNGNYNHRRNTGRSEEAATRNRDEKTFVNETKYKINIWNYTIGKRTDNGSHPAVFPEKLASDHIISWSNNYDTVLDCFMGSGTTIKMAKQLNRKAIGIEIEEKYCEIAVKRLQQSVLEF